MASERSVVTEFLQDEVKANRELTIDERRLKLEPSIDLLIRKHGNRPEPILKWKAISSQWVRTKRDVLPSGAIHTNDGFNPCIIDPPTDPIANMEARKFYHDTVLARINRDIRALELRKEGKGNPNLAWKADLYGEPALINHSDYDYPKCIAILMDHRKEHVLQQTVLTVQIRQAREKLSGDRARYLRSSELAG